MKGEAVPLGKGHAVGIATQLIDVQSLPLVARKSREEASADSWNLKNQNDAERLDVLVLLNLVEDGVPDAFDQAVRCLRIDLALNNHDLILG